MEDMVKLLWEVVEILLATEKGAKRFVRLYTMAKRFGSTAEEVARALEPVKRDYVTLVTILMRHITEKFAEYLRSEGKDKDAEFLLNEFFDPFVQENYIDFGVPTLNEAYENDWDLEQTYRAWIKVEVEE